MFDAWDILEDEAIGLGFIDQPPEFLDEAAPLIRSHFSRRSRAINLESCGTEPTITSLIAIFDPIGCFRKGLAGRPADDDQRIALSQ